MNINELPEIDFTQIPCWDELCKILRQFEKAAPELVRLDTIGKSAQGRELLLITLTDFSTGNPDDRPALFFQEGLHAAELTVLSCSFIKKLLAEHAPGGILSRRTFYLMPRLNPDGAEMVLKNSFGAIRSKIPSHPTTPNTLQLMDIDGDGRILTMLIPTPTGNLIKDPAEPRLLLPRKGDSSGPFYRAIPEGMIHDWDGFSEIQTEPLEDWNRNWGSGWQPKAEHGQLPFSAVEIRSVAEFIASHRNIFTALSLHVGGEAILIPPGRHDATVEPFDRKIMTALGMLAKESCGVPIYHNCEYNIPPFRWLWPFSDRPGTFQDFCYQYFGIPNADLETSGGLYAEIGVKTAELEHLESWDEYHDLNRRLLQWYDRQTDVPELCAPWKKFSHPQLGEVEIGGMIPLIFNQRHISQREEECKKISQFLLKVASTAPELIWHEFSAEKVADELWRIRVTVGNCGELSTHLTSKALGLSRFPASRLQFCSAPGVELLSREPIREFKDLAGFSGKISGEWFVRAPEKIKTLGTVTVICGAAGKKQRICTK